ncbi:MAG TPA: hypothetical protein VGG08_08820 [Solirubrobacteraceae bacterium]|jgi:hypothetical protein
MRLGDNMRIPGVAGVAAAVLAVALVPGAAQAADPSVTVVYKGTLSEKFVSKTSDPSDFEVELTLEWEEKATDDAVTREPISPPSFSISGSLTTTSAHEHPKSCSAKLSTRPGPYGNAPAGYIAGGLVTIAAVLPSSGKYVQSDGSENCAIAPNQGVGVGGSGVPDPEFVAAIAPGASFPESQPSYSHTFSVPHYVHRELAPNGQEESENTMSLSATLTATTSVLTGRQGTGTGGGSSPGGGGKGSTGKKPLLPRGKSLDKAKQQARRDLPEALKEAWGAHGLQSLTALSGAPLLMVADELGQSVAPLAGNDATTRVLDDLRIIDDPPRADVFVLARAAPAKAPVLPACGQAEATLSSWCARLSDALARLLVADGNASAADTAIEQTVSRASAARHARNATALTLQERHIPGLEQTLATALAAKRRAAGPVRTLLREARPRWSLTRAQAAAAIGFLKRRLKHDGISAATLTRLAHGALTPAYTEVLTLL